MLARQLDILRLVVCKHLAEGEGCQWGTVAHGPGHFHARPAGSQHRGSQTLYRRGEGLDGRLERIQPLRAEGDDHRALVEDGTRAIHDADAESRRPEVARRDQRNAQFSDGRQGIGRLDGHPGPTLVGVQGNAQPLAHMGDVPGQRRCLLAGFQLVQGDFRPVADKEQDRRAVIVLSAGAARSYPQGDPAGEQHQRDSLDHVWLPRKQARRSARRSAMAFAVRGIVYAA